MTVFEFRTNLKHFSSKICLVDAEGHEVFFNNLGIFVHWVKLPIYDGRTIDYITPDDNATYIVYLED